MADFLSLPNGKSLRSSQGHWYKILQLLGTGGNAITYLTLCTSGSHTGVLFALKLFRKLSKPERRKKFLQESEFLREHDHPSIMRVFDDGEFDYETDGKAETYPFLVAEYLPRTLDAVIRGRQSTSAERITFALQLLSALVALDALNPRVVHRDIKPQNIFVKGRSCVLGDFGLLKLLDDDEDEDKEFFKESVGPGMPFYYRTPDLVAYARGEAALTTKSDVYQLGLVLAHLFTGRNPCKRPPAGQFLAPVELEKIGAIPGAFSGGVFALLQRMLNANPDQRPSASELMGGWMGVFADAVERATALEGRVL